MTVIKYISNGKEVTREEFTKNSRLDEVFESGETGLGQSSSGWPRTSFSMGVHPDQIPAAMEKARRMGVPTEFSNSGEPILTSPTHQKRYAKQVLGYEDLGTRVNTGRLTREDPTK